MEQLKFRKRAPLWVFAVQYVQERIRIPSTRKKIADFIAYFLPKEKHKLLLGNDLEKELAINGYCHLAPIITHIEADELKDELIKLTCFDPWKANLGDFKIEDVPKEVHTAQIRGILNIEKIIRIANNPEVLSLCTKYFKCTPIIDSIQAWWSLPGHETPEQAENFHRDNDGIRFLKYFIYLTDVTENSGPHAYVVGSHIDDKGLERRRYKDEEIRHLFGSDSIKYFTGSKGISFLEDTYGFHKGQPAKSGKRLLLQIRYSIMPTVFLNKNYKSINANHEGYDTYINKYILK